MAVWPIEVHLNLIKDCLERKVWIWRRMGGLTVSDKEFLGLAELLDLALLVHLVGLLVVDEEVGTALATHPLVEDLLVRLFLERLLRTPTNSN